MLFNSPEFIFLFLPTALIATLLARYLFGSKGAVCALIVASLAFYATWRVWAVWLLIASISINLCCGLLMLRVRAWAWHLLIFGLIFNLSLLGYFKYADFFLTSFGIAAGSIGAIILPLGISFYTFQKIAFLVDIYRGRIQEVRTMEFVLMAAFFPQLIAGPIVHYQEVASQYADRIRVNADTVALGLSVFAFGLAKKVFLADTLAIYVKQRFDAAAAGPVEFFGSWIGALAYTFQLYFDFSGYSDMAIGLALMFGIVLPVNFLSPYKSTSIIEFWRRWHITLSRFLRDYLYVPLGGNRRGELHRHGNLITVMLLGGLWHGAAWTFVFWGGLHGIYLVLNHLWRRVGGRLPALLAAPVCFLAVVLAWVFFRAPTFEVATTMLRGMAGLEGAIVPYGVMAWLDLSEYRTWAGASMNPVDFAASFVVIGVAAAIAFLTPNTMQIFGLVESRAGAPRPLTATLRTPAVAGILLALSMLGVIGAAPTEFLYFQF